VGSNKGLTIEERKGYKLSSPSFLWFYFSWWE
jgi:hypothetical protein